MTQPSILKTAIYVRGDIVARFESMELQAPPESGNESEIHPAQAPSLVHILFQLHANNSVRPETKLIESVVLQ